MESRWTGSVEDAFFDGEAFDHCRQLNQPEYEASARGSKNAYYYVISADIGRKSDKTEISILKVTPQPERLPIVSLVNLMTLDNMHFEEQAVQLKKIYYKYNARRIVIDGNGPGVGMIDYLVKQQIDADTGEVVLDFGIENDPDKFYKKYQTKDCELNAVYIVMANAAFNTEMYVNL